MIKREKVLKGLEHCTSFGGTYTPCNGCPYDDAEEHCQGSLLEEALSLLREQEPRVMTLEEANETLMHGDFVIMEDRETDMIWLGMRGDDNIDLASGEYFDFDDLEKQEYRHEYGRSFRFWTSRPTDEQRKAVKWNE